MVPRVSKKHEMRSITLHGQGDSAPAEQIVSEMRSIREALSEYDAGLIYNVDETGLFYKALPRRSYVMCYENKKAFRGKHNMNAEDRATAYVCTNSNGSHKLPMAVIGKTKRPRCFRDNTLWFLTSQIGLLGLIQRLSHDGSYMSFLREYQK